MPSLQRNKCAKQTATEIKAKLKVLRKYTLDNFSQKMFQAKEANNGKLPHCFVTSLIDEIKSLCPWMNRDVVSYHFKRWSKSNRMISHRAPLLFRHNQYRCHVIINLSAT